MTDEIRRRAEEAREKWCLSGFAKDSKAGLGRLDDLIERAITEAVERTAQEASRQIRSAQAECAAMREALKFVDVMADQPEPTLESAIRANELIQKALSGEAGKAMGKRISDLEAGCRDLKAALDMEREAEAIQRQRATDLEARLREAVEARCGISGIASVVAVPNPTPTPGDEARAAQAWCEPETSGIEMDTRLATAFARILATVRAEADERTRLWKALAKALDAEKFLRGDVLTTAQAREALKAAGEVE